MRNVELGIKTWGALTNSECEMRNVEFEMKDWGVQTNFTFLISNSTLKL